MPIDYKIPEKIIETLKEGPLSVDEIISRIRSGPYPSPKKDESYYDKFNSLLASHEIMIVDYIPSDKRNKFPVKNLVLSLVKMESIHVLNLIREIHIDQLENNENDAKETAYNIIKKLFIRKFQQMLFNNQNEWGALLELVVVKDPRVEDLLCYEGELEEDAFLIAHHNLMNNTEIAFKGIGDKLEKYRDFSLIKNKYPNALLYYLKHDENKEEALDMEIEFILNKPIKQENGSIILLRDTSEFYDIYYSKELSIDGEIDKEEYLESLGFAKPREWSYNQIESLFEEIFFYVFSEESGELKLKLSIAISDNPKSFKFLNEIVGEFVS